MDISALASSLAERPHLGPNVHLTASTSAHHAPARYLEMLEERSTATLLRSTTMPPLAYQACRRIRPNFLGFIQR